MPNPSHLDRWSDRARSRWSKYESESRWHEQEHARELSNWWGEKRRRRGGKPQVGTEFEGVSDWKRSEEDAKKQAKERAVLAVQSAASGLHEEAVERLNRQHDKMRYKYPWPQED